MCFCPQFKICLSHIVYHTYIWSVHYELMSSLWTHKMTPWLPVGLKAQLVEHCTCITEIMGSIPVQAWIFFGLFFRYCSRSVNNWDELKILTWCFCLQFKYLSFTLLSMIHVYPLKDHYKLTKWLAPSGFDSVAQLVEQCTGITEVMDSIPVFHILSITAFISLINFSKLIIFFKFSFSEVQMFHRFMSWCWLNIGLSSTFAKLLKSFCYCLASYFYFFLLKFINNRTDAFGFWRKWNNSHFYLLWSLAHVQTIRKTLHLDANHCEKQRKS